MENNQDHIIKAFREGLAHHEVVVSDSVWTGVQTSLATNAAATSGVVSSAMMKAASVVGVSAVVGLGAYNEIELHRVDQTKESISQVTQVKDAEISVDQSEEQTIAVNDKTWNDAVNQSVSNSSEKKSAELEKAIGETGMVREVSELTSSIDDSEGLAENADHSETPVVKTENEVAEASNVNEIKKNAQNNEPQLAEQESKKEDGAVDESSPSLPPLEEKEEEQTCALRMTHAAKAFISPDGDGTNECFSAEGAETATEFKITIWTRSGDLLFESTDPNFKWCGEDRFGNLVESRTMCYYKIDAFDDKGMQYKNANAKGSVQVFR